MDLNHEDNQVQDSHKKLSLTSSTIFREKSLALPSLRIQLSDVEKLKEFIMEFLRKEILWKRGQFFVVEICFLNVLLQIDFLTVWLSLYLVNIDIAF